MALVTYTDAMSAQTGRRKATDQDVVDAPEGLVAEVLGGELLPHRAHSQGAQEPLA